MRRFVQSVLSFGVVFLLAFGPVQAAERSTVLTKNTDIPGADYSILKDVKLDACQSACEADRVCRAFTFNQKAKWCFLKGDAGLDSPVAGATSGHIIMVPSAKEIAAARESELPFPGSDLINSALGFAAGLPQSDAPPPGLTYADLVAAGDEASAQSNAAGAMVSYRQALAIVDNDPAIWLKLANLALTRADEDLAAQNTSSAYDFSATASYAALNAFLQSESVDERAGALSALAHALEGREMWREAIATYRASLALIDDANLQARLDLVVGEHGFRITSNAVDAEAASPRICAVFSDSLPASDLSSYVSVQNAPNVAVETEDSQICVTGVEHGSRYHITLRAGLPSASGETLRNDVEISAYVPDRAPFVGFANNTYVMPAGLGGGLPITSVNAQSADVAIYRIGDRSIATAVRNGIFQGNLSGNSAEDVANQYGEKVFEGQVDLAQGASNALVTTAIPVANALKDMQPGAYVVTAKVAGAKQDYWDDVATQWFIVTDLGLTTLSGDDGVHGFVRSLTSAEPIGNAKVKLVAVNNEILGEGVTDADGRADFAPGLARGTGGRAPQLLVAETEGGDYAFLDVSKPSFDLTDRGVDGRFSPGPLDLFATTERGVYRPTETVFLTALLRDPHAKAVSGLPLTLELVRPDGVVATREVIKDQGAGGYSAALLLNEDAMRGGWSIRLYADPKAAPLSSVSFLVEDFEPERLALEISAPDGAVQTDAVTSINVAAKYLYGASAPNLNVEADAVLQPVTTLAEFPGYSFGRFDEFNGQRFYSLGVVGTTDEAGNAVAEVTLPEPDPTTRPLEANITLRLLDSNGRAIQRAVSRPVLAKTDRIGIKFGFDTYQGLAQGSRASFDIIAVAPGNEKIAKAGLNWTLSRVDTNYQWYRDNGTWKWEAISTSRQVANGSIDTKADAPVTIGAPVDWGRYQLEVTSTDGVSSSVQFYAGYYYADAGSDTPDTLKVGLDKASYKIGDVAKLRLDPQFAGTALVMVVDDRIISMQAVEVPEGGTSVDLKVTEDWGPGAYVTALLYKPASAEAKRMPSRSIGLAYADVDPGTNKLDVSIEAAAETLPRHPFTAKIKLNNLVAGQKAYVAVAAVDLGILNLTNFSTPDPDGYFFGQRRLGVEFRDLYGKLIDPTQGAPGALRSGGDDGEADLGVMTGDESLASITQLLALYSGIVEVGADGTASVTFDMPDLNGTARLMAMAWTETGMGHASLDVLVRDPVVVTLSPPRFLRLDDVSRVLVEINNVSGPAGTYKVQLISSEGLKIEGGERSLDLAAGARTSLDLKLTATQIGNQSLKLLVTAPNGDAQVKELTLGVRAASGPQTVSTLVPLRPGEDIKLEQDRFAGLIPESAFLTLAIGPVARLDVPRLLLDLDRYPYGCAEQISSRALPLLYLNEVAQKLGLGDDGELDQRIKDAISNLLAKQTYSGGFGLWSARDYYSDLWLDAYVTDFLLRAKAGGYQVADLAMTMALDNLSNQVSYAADFSDGGEAIAYALYDLSRAGRASMADLRYYFEARLDAFGSPLAKAQLGAALALYGDRSRSAEAFAAAIDGLKLADNPKIYRADYGSQMRDVAAVLALAAEFTPSGIDLPGLTKQLADLRDLSHYTSTQEDAWTLVAAAALTREAGKGAVSINGEALTGTIYQRYVYSQLAGTPVSVVNNGNAATEMKVSVTGIPVTPPVASSQGFSIDRYYYLPDGTATDLSVVKQNDRFVVVIDVTATTLGSGQYVVDDLLPAGFEIENPDLSTGAGVADLSWLSVTAPSHVEARTDRYVAAFRYFADTPQFSTAYLVRAVSPGQFVLPWASVEDMYRPELRANTDAYSVEVKAAGP